MLLCTWPEPAAAYSVLSHEAIIDSAWDTGIRTAILLRYPNTTQEELREAHAYAYGGAIIQDMGYYPYGSKFFSNLTHYVRSGDFVQALIRDSKSPNDYAFALGALAHYVADNEGHRLATNLSVALLYPRLRKKYGDIVTFEDDPLAHIKTEFGFDVLEVARERFAPQSYHDFIGFEVAAPLLAQAFQETYGLPIASVLDEEDKTLGSYRHDVSKLIPKATRIAWSLKKKEIKADEPGITKRRFLFNMSRSSYERRWGKEYQRPSFGDRFLAFLYRLIPKIGPLKILQFRTPTPETEKLFESSFNTTMTHYRRLLLDQERGELTLPNDNFDVGAATGPGQYKLNDETHARLLEELAKQDFVGASPELCRHLMAFFSQSQAPYAMRNKPEDWARVEAALQQLKQARTGDLLPAKTE